MTVYIEQVILDNFAVNLLIVLSCVKLLKREAVKWRIAASAAAGTIFAVLYPFIEHSLALYKGACVAVMTLLYLPYKTIKQFLFSTLCFLGLSFLLGGAVSAMMNFGARFTDAFNGGGGGILGATLLSAIFLVYFLTEVRHFIYKKAKAAAVSLKTSFKLGNDDFSVNALMDSGNSLYDAFTGSCVCVLSREIANPYLTGRERRIKAVTVGGECEMPLLKLQNLNLNGRIIPEALAAVSGSFAGEYSLILHSDLLGDGADTVVADGGGQV